MTSWRAGDAGTALPSFCDWIKAHGIEPTSTYGVEVKDGNVTFLRFCEEGGSKHVHGKCPSNMKFKADPEAVWTDVDRSPCIAKPYTMELIEQLPADFLEIQAKVRAANLSYINEHRQPDNEQGQAA